MHTAHNAGFLLRPKGAPRNLYCLWLCFAQTEFSFLHHLDAIELVSPNCFTKNLMNLNSKWYFKIPCSQTHSSSEMPPTIYSFASLKYDHARQRATCIQWNSIFLITGSIDQSVCKGLMQALSHLLQTVGEPLLLLLHLKALLDSNDGILYYCCFKLYWDPIMGQEFLLCVHI